MTTRIAILGGGISALAAAYEIKRADPHGAYDITVYQMGWRLGGKCASSRNLSPGMDFRNEDHGLHVLGGWYHNTFEMMRAVYADWEKTGVADATDFETAFLPFNGAVLFDHRTDLLGVRTGWRKLAVRFPPPRGQPGLDIPELSLKVLVRRALDWTRHILKGSPETSQLMFESVKAFKAPLDPLDELLENYDAAMEAGWPDEVSEAYTGRLDALTEGLVADAQRSATVARKQTSLESMKLFAPEPDGDLTLFDYTCLGILGLVITRGIIRDKLFTKGLDAANHEETMVWLRRHGAPEFVITSPFVALGYHYAFSYVDGDPARPDMAAGTALRGYLRMLFGQSGSFFYHFNGGIGEVLIKPLYDVLKARGVKFEFFCDVRSVEPGENNLVDRVNIRRQAKVRNGNQAYEPLYTLPDGTRVWPDRPLFDQLEISPGQQSFPKDFEDPEDVGPGDPVETLKLGEHFDLVILAIPGTALKTICAGLAENSQRWRAYLANVWSSPTLNAQLWTKARPDQLGSAGLPPITTGHVLPLSTWCDMSHQLAFETPSAFNGLHFLCGPHAPGRKDPRQLAQDWLADNFDDVLPHWQTRREPATNRSLYVRLNVHPSDLYIFAPARSVEHRMRCTQSGFSNLLLCGDWVRNGTDLGWVEGAVTSARQCSRALTNSPARIYGETDFG